MKAFNRRLFLGASVAAILAVSSSLTEARPLRGGGVTFYNGNPNINVTLNSIAGSITCSRDQSGSAMQTFCFIQVSASGITCSGTTTSGQPIIPFEDLSYSWNFGDPNGKELFVRPNDNVAVNANNSQVGPEATYVYRNAGTYICTLTVVGKSGAGYTVATITRAFVVGAFSPSADLFVDQVNGNDSNPGTKSLPKQSISAIIAGLGSNQRVNLALGSHWQGASGIALPNVNITGCRIQSYDPGNGGARPIVEVNVNSTPQPPFTFTNGSSSAASKIDIIISGIDFTSSLTQAANATYGNATGALQDIYFDNCNFNCTAATSTSVVTGGAFSSGSSAIAAGLISGWGFWNGAITNPLSSTTIRMGIAQATPALWFSLVGISISGAGSSQAAMGLDHHVYPEVQNHSLYQWVTFGATGAPPYQRNQCVNTNWNSISGGNEFAQYTVFSENLCSDLQRTFDAGESSAIAANFTGGSANITVSNWNVANGPAPTAGQQIWFGSGSLLPNNISAGTFYFVNTISGITFTISTSFPGTDIVASNTFVGSGSPVIFRTTYKNYVSQRNFLINLAGSMHLFDQAQSATIRDERATGCLNAPTWFSPNAAAGNMLTPRLYRNRIYIEPNAVFSGTITGTTLTLVSPPSFGSLSIGQQVYGATGSVVTAGTLITSGSGLTWAVSISQTTTAGAVIGAGPAIGFGNIAILMDDPAYVNPLQITDNVIFDPRTVAQCNGFAFASQPASGAIIDRNQYYAPNDTDSKFLYNGTTPDSFSTWQAQLLDVNGSVANPGWNTPPAQWSDFGP